MKLISAIYNAPVQVIDYDEDYVGVTVFYDGHRWTGKAHLNPKDTDFFSTRVGKRIALSRARIQIMRYELNKMQEAIKQRELFYREVCGYGSKDYMEVDPTDAFRKNINRNKIRYQLLESKLAQEEKSLSDYLENLEMVINTVRKIRTTQEKDNNN